MGFTQIREDLCVFVLYVDGKLKVIAAGYVNDIIIGSDTKERIDRIGIHEILNSK